MSLPATKTGLKNRIRVLERELKDRQRRPEHTPDTTEGQYWKAKYELLRDNVLNPPRNEKGQFLPRSEWLW